MGFTEIRIKIMNRIQLAKKHERRNEPSGFINQIVGYRD